MTATTPPIWTLTPEDERTERTGRIDEWAGQFADILSIVYGHLRGKLPPKLADAVTLEYVRMILAGGSACAECEADSGVDVGFYENGDEDE